MDLRLSVLSNARSLSCFLIHIPPSRRFSFFFFHLGWSAGAVFICMLTFFCVLLCQSFGQKWNSIRRLGFFLVIIFDILGLRRRFVIRRTRAKSIEFENPKLKKKKKRKNNSDGPNEYYTSILVLYYIAGPVDLKSSFFFFFEKIKSISSMLLSFSIWIHVRSSASIGKCTSIVERDIPETIISTFYWLNILRPPLPPYYRRPPPIFLLFWVMVSFFFKWE